MYQSVQTFQLRQVNCKKIIDDNRPDVMPICKWPKFHVFFFITNSLKSYNTVDRISTKNSLDSNTVVATG